MDNDIELRHLRYFVAVAEELHFGRAAARLHLAQPPLSQQIRRLEEILGYPLFVRTSRTVKLTAAGEVFLNSARRTLRNVKDDMEEVRSIGRGDVGSLRVGFIGSGMLTPLPAMLGQYRRQYPRVQLQLRETYTSGVVQSLLRGMLDAGFLRDGDPTEGIVTETLFSEPFVAVLPHTHPLATRTGISAGQLRDEPFVYFSPMAVQEAPQWLTILRLVGAGLGVTIAPACVRQIVAPNIVCLNLHGAKLNSDIELAYQANESRAIVKAFAEIARASFRAAARHSKSKARSEGC
jgi:DNA-binding transcriptional LysR family regulator